VIVQRSQLYTTVSMKINLVVPLECYALLSDIFLYGDVMVSVLASSAVDRGFQHRSGQTAKHTTLRRKWDRRSFLTKKISQFLFLAVEAQAHV